MDRKHFLRTLGLMSFAGSMMKLNALEKWSSEWSSTAPMPVLFLGHGSPMNAIEENEFVNNFKRLGKALPQPRAIICISAHWETRGTFITAMENPRTIHDFGGFPQELFDVQYPAGGDPDLASETRELITKTTIELDHEWGLDHGAWTVIKHLYPNADIPVLQLSIDHTKAPDFHYELARQLSVLRKKGILIIGSGNMVHNLRMVAWNKLSTPGYGYDWAKEADAGFKKMIKEQQHRELVNFRSLGKAYDLAIPTPEHYLPLLYTLGLRDGKDEVSIFNDKTVGGSLSMTSIMLSTS